MAAEVIDLTSSPDTSDDEEDYGEREFASNRTFIDFESEESIPNLTVKTFLLDCCQHPKILLHKEFEFFRSYLCEVGLKFEIPANAPVLENHEDNAFCLEKGDGWLQALKERVNNENRKDFYWASMIPVRRRDDLGLVMFKWEPLPMSIDWLQMYIAYCRSNSQIVNDKTDDPVEHNMENVDDYIKDFLKRFSPYRNMDVEERFKGAKEGSEYRKQNNLKGPSKTDLLYLFRRQPQPIERPAVASTSTTGATKNRYLSSDTSDTDTDSSSSSSESSGSEYGVRIRNGKYSTVKSQRKKRKVVKAKTKHTKKVQRSGTSAVSFPLPANGLVNGFRLLDIKIVLQKCSIPTRLNEEISPANASKNSTVPKDSTSPEPPADRDKDKPSISSIASAIIKTRPTTTSTGSCSAKEKENVTICQTKNPSASAATRSSNAKENVINGQANIANKKSRPKAQSKYCCEICWFGTSFSSQKLLDKHIRTKHSSKKRELVTCKCGQRIKKSSVKSHQQSCKKTIGNSVKP